jgi:GNAT superfamily N-acetyltransferase
VAETIQIVAVDPEHEHARSCLARYVRELNQRSQRTFDPEAGATITPDEVRPPLGRFVVVYMTGEPIGCGAVTHPPRGPAHIKRMWIAPEARGQGLGRQLLNVLESYARDAGAKVGQIETNSDLTEALALYTATGWAPVERFNDEPYADRWLQKPLRERSDR